MNEANQETQLQMEQSTQMEQPEVQQKKKRPFLAIGFGILMIIIFYVIQIIGILPVTIGFVAKFIIENGSQADPSQQELMEAFTNQGVITVATTVATVLTTVVFSIWYYIQYGKKHKFKGNDDLKNIFTIKKTILYILAALACYLLALDVMSLISLFSPETVDSYVTMMQELQGGNEGLMALTVVLLAPFGEECIFRGILLKNFKKHLPVLAAIILQAVFFGIFHMNIVQGIYVVILGCVCGYAAHKEKSVLPAILIHLVYNSCSYIFQLLPESILDMDLLWVFAPIVPIVIGIALYRAFGFQFSLEIKD